MDDHVYRYGFSATQQQIVAESLAEELKSGSPRPLFNRSRSSAGAAASITFANDFDSVASEAIRKLTRDNALVLSSGANLNVQLLQKIYQCLTQRLRCINFIPFGNGPRNLAIKLHENADFRQRIEQLASDADFGISGFRTKMPPEPSPQEIDRLRQNAAPQFGEKAAEIAAAQLNAARIPTVFALHTRPGGEQVELHFANESQGTQLFVQLAALMLDAAWQNAVIIIDEFGSNIHPLLASRMVELFYELARESGKGQLIFTTHQSELMSPELFRKDQLWLVEKSAAGESEIFSLASFRGEKSARSTEAFAKNYLAGRYGGVGHFGPLLSGASLEVTPTKDGDI